MTSFIELRSAQGGNFVIARSLIFTGFSRHRLRLSALVVTLALSSTPLHAQQTLGSVLGTVTDASGSIVMGAQVSIIDQQTGYQRTAISIHWLYTFHDLPINTYTFTFAQPGFSNSKFQTFWCKPIGL